MADLQQHYDAVIVGGGIGGGALATVLSRAGHSVLVLEKSTTYPDRVRGEWIAPWGVAEARRLGLYETLTSAGGHHVTRHVGYGEEVTPAEAEATALPLGLLPGIPGPLCIRHPVACDALRTAAEAAGATFLRGVSGVTVEPGANPAVSFVQGGGDQRVSCRLIVGADGRAGVTRAQAGIEEQADPPHHLFSGMLVEGADRWPDETQTKGTEGLVNFFVFPQGGGKARLYLGYGFDRKTLLSGKDNRQRFLQEFRLKCVPNSDALAGATPISPCVSYPNNDTWTDVPYVDGLVLVGDAAGHNDPIIGQGLAITLRDVRIVSEALLNSADWSTRIFADYADQRREYLRRLRFSAGLQAILDSEFGPDAVARRLRYRERAAADPTLSLPFLAVMVGPENVPEAVFTEEVRARILG